MKVNKQNLRRISQGDIYRNVDYIEYVAEKSGQIEVSIITFPLIVVLSQDCDLEQDFRFRYGRPRPKTHDKFLLSVLVAPLYNAEYVFTGEHLSELEIKMQEISRGRTPGEFIKNNQNPRYHFVDFPEDIPIVPSIIDFKHYFSVNIEYLKKEKKQDFICRIPKLYREDLSHRYASFLSRIGIP
ncbi:MAG: hypothetical protein JW715_05360 [Sedimentisphaerales bacterium]|nr:hypothetical protein [Sedimentisphaerales bacterium]